jgi:hypothetical protein
MVGVSYAVGRVRVCGLVRGDLRWVGARLGEGGTEGREIVVVELELVVVGSFRRVLDVGHRVTFSADGIFRCCLVRYARLKLK